MLEIMTTRRAAGLRKRSPIVSKHGFSPRELRGLDLWLRADLDVSTGGARQFTATNSENFEIADNASLSTGDVDFTFAGWVYIDNQASNRNIFAKYDTTGENREHRLHFLTSGNFTFSVSSSGTSAALTDVEATSLGVPATGQWYFIVCEHDSANDTISIQVNNGTVNTSAHSAGVFDGAAAFHFGSRVAGEYFWGRLARFGFWKRTLTTVERTELYNSGRSLFYNDLPADLLTSLVSYWDLNEPSGDAIDSHGSNNLADNNTVTAADGITPRVRQFTRINTEYFEKADNTDLSTGDIDFSLAGWVYLDSKPSNETFVAKYSTSNGEREFRVFYDVSADRFVFNVSHDGTYQAPATAVADSLGSPASGQWYFIVAQHDSTANTLSLQANDGPVDVTSWSSGVYDSISPLQVGRRAIGDYMAGKLSRWGFWKRTLTTAERTALYNDGRGLFHTDLTVAQKASLISFWNFNEIDGDAIDSEGSNHLTDNNTVTSLLGPFEALGAIADGDPVAAWTDRSKNIRQFSQTTLAKRPIYRAAGIGGQAAIEFDGVDDLLVLAENYLRGSSGAVFAVVELSASPSSNQAVLAASDESAGLYTVELRAYRDGSNKNISARIDDNTNNNVFHGDTTIAADITYIQAWISDGSVYTMRVNGVDQTITPVAGLDNGNWFGDLAEQHYVSIGAYKRASENGFLKGRISEIIVYDNDKTSAELSRIERYLANRYGVTLP